MLVKLELRLSILFLALFHVLLLYPAVLTGEETKSAEQPATNEQKLSLIEIYSWSNSLPKDLIDLRNNLESLTDLAPVENKLPEIASLIEDLEWEGTTLQSNPNLTYHEISSFDSKLINAGTKLSNLNTAISNNIKNLETWYKNWLSKEKEFQALADMAQRDFQLDDTLPDFASLSEIIVSGKLLLEQHLKSNLLAGHELGKDQAKLYELSDIASDLIKEVSETGKQQTSPSMLSAEFYDLLDRNHFVEGWENIRLFTKYQWGYVGQNRGLVAASLIIVLVLAILVYLSKPLVAADSKWFVFASKPVITALFIFSAATGIGNTLAIEFYLPPDWDTLIYLPLFFAVGILAENICTKPSRTTLLRHLLFYSGLSLLLSVFDLPKVLFHLFVFYASVVLLSYYLVLFARRWLKSSERKMSWSVLVWGIFPLIIIVAGVSGYDQLAIVIFGRVLAFIAATITIRLMLLFFSGLLELLLTNAHWLLIRKNAATIVKQITPLLVLLHFILWLCVILTITWMYPTLNVAFKALTSLQLTFQSITISPDSVLFIILIIYTTILVSRGLRAFLLQEVLPGYGVERGVQLSIARLVHYAVLAIGFIVLLSALGFGLNQITILGGALGVGIGFGLQAIVNNFVSGLILLFERPIKVGDMIDIGDQVGEVKELGLRATTVQTFDNAEIVIPNSELVTSSVTNWTLAEKKIRVKIPVGVAYGTDLSKVLEILLACADANPIVLSTPKPVALFLAFGSSSLDFELRVWIADFNDKLTVLSDLNQDIDSEFAMAGIEIPFPQTDLHLRSIDEDAAEKLSRTRSASSRQAPATTEDD